MKMIILIAGIFSVILIFSCERGIKVKTGNEIIELKGFEAKKGKHCESTSIMNALKYQGLDLSEAMINGLGSSISFGMIKEGGFPFLGCRTGDMKESFIKNSGVKMKEFQPGSPQEAYDFVKNILKQGIPVILRVDMRYLPYRYGGKYGSKNTSFGWHFVTLVGINEVTGYALVTETDDAGLKPVERIKIYDLAKARNSTEGYFKAGNYCYYFDSPAEIKIDHEKALISSLNAVMRNMNESGLKSLRNLKKDLNDIEKYIGTKYVLKPLFYTFYGYIEIFGTGGAGFRNFYRDYIVETGKILDDPAITGYSEYVDNSCRKWNELSNEFKNISENIEKYYNDKDERKAMYSIAGILADELYEAEAEMIKKMEELSSMLQGRFPGNIR